METDRRIVIERERREHNKKERERSKNVTASINCYYLTISISKIRRILHLFLDVTRDDINIITEVWFIYIY